MPLALKALILFVVGIICGVMNALAGGGTLLSFPTMIFLGVPSVIANATNTVAMQLGIMASFWSYRREFVSQKKWAWRFGPPSLLGGLLGAILLLHTSENYFRAFVPYLLLFATVLFTLRPQISRLLKLETQTTQKTRHGLVLAIIFQFLVGIYGGYFGAGIGILMLAVLGLLVPGDIHEMNSLRVLMGGLINGVASIYFIAARQVYWREALVLGFGAILGGYTGPMLARRVGPSVVRKFVIAIGFGSGFYFLFRR